MSTLNQNAQGVQAQVLYEYEAHDDDQLTIKPGDIITIIDDSQDLNGWALAQKGYVLFCFVLSLFCFAL